MECGVIMSNGFGVLSDRDINLRLSELFNSPIHLADIQPASVDLHLGDVLLNIDGEEFVLLDKDYILEPGEFILGSTSEYVTVPCDLVAQVDGKSSIGRLGIDVHKTAGWIDPGFEGNITLEIKNNSDRAFILRKGMCFCQIIFFTLSSPCIVPYGDNCRCNHYQGSKGTVLSKY
jgi:dCTP deaminase